MRGAIADRIDVGQRCAAIFIDVEEGIGGRPLLDRDLDGLDDFLYAFRYTSAFECGDVALALGASFGALFAPSKYFSVGASVRTASKITFSGDATMAGAPSMGMSADSEAERESTSPMVAGIGIAVKPTDKLTFVADAVWTQWSKLE